MELVTYLVKERKETQIIFCKVMGDSTQIFGSGT